MTKVIRSLLSLLTLVILLIANNSVFAHVEGKMQLSAADAGPYKVTAWTSPDPAEIGEIHVALSIFRADDASPILDADVNVTMTF